MTIDIVEERGGQPIPCRIELRDSRGKAQKTRGALNHGPYSVVDGLLVFRGRAGEYEFDVFHGPEFAKSHGGFTLDRSGDGTDVVRLPRYADMASEGWYAGDLLARVPADVAAAWLAAEGLELASAVSDDVRVVRDAATGDAATGDTAAGDAEQKVGKPTDNPAARPRKPAAIGSGKQLTLLENVGGGYYDDRPESGLILHRWQPPAAVPETLPSSRLLAMAKRDASTHAEIGRLWARDTPIWLASGLIDSIQVLSEHVTRDGRSGISVDTAVHPEPSLFKGPRGPGRLVENLYWQVLETGLRIPPSGGSGVGRSSSPLGYNRVYVHPSTSTRPSMDGWWQGLREGRCFVTNGPLLRAQVNGQYSGYTFRQFSGEKLMLDVSLTLTVADPVEYVDVIFNGEAVYHARLDEYAKQGGKIPALEITESGWIVIRVVTQREETYRLATTAPYYVEYDGQPRITRAACQLFSDWLERSIVEHRQSDPTAAQANSPYTEAARAFWRRRLELASD